MQCRFREDRIRRAVARLDWLRVDRDCLAVAEMCRLMVERSWSTIVNWSKGRLRCRSA